MQTPQEQTFMSLVLSDGGADSGEKDRSECEWHEADVDRSGGNHV
jgi:hypothetical protein